MTLVDILLGVLVRVNEPCLNEVMGAMEKKKKELKLEAMHVEQLINRQFECHVHFVWELRFCTILLFSFSKYA